jgi:hypothetical protein
VQCSQEQADEKRFALRKSTQTGELGGFSIHAGVTVHAADKNGRERLIRYCARPALSITPYFVTSACLGQTRHGESCACRRSRLHHRRSRLRRYLNCQTQRQQRQIRTGRRFRRIPCGLRPNRVQRSSMARCFPPVRKDKTLHPNWPPVRANGSGRRSVRQEKSSIAVDFSRSWSILPS